jgi:hypothetical protein
MCGSCVHSLVCQVKLGPKEERREGKREGNKIVQAERKANLLHTCSPYTSPGVQILTVPGQTPD